MSFLENLLAGDKRQDYDDFVRRSVETTVLMTVEETLEALAKSKSIGYRRPGE